MKKSGVLGSVLILSITILFLSISFVSASLTDELFSYYPMKETSSTTLIDYSDNPHHGAYYGTFTLNQTFGTQTGAHFDGSTGYANGTGINGSTNFSVSLWYKLDTAGAGFTATVVSIGNESQAGKYLRAIKIGGTLYFDRGQQYITTAVGIDTNPHNLVAVYNGSVLRGYIDGVSIGNVSTNITLGNSNLLIGVGPDNHFFPGYISEVALWNRSLTSSEISQIYNSGNGTSVVSFLVSISNYSYTSPVSLSMSDSLATDFWYNNGTTNVTYTSPVDISLSEGNYLWTFYANESGNVISKQVNFTIDNTAPSINLFSPTNTTYFQSNISLNVTTNENNVTWKYNINGTNISFTPNISLILINGAKTLIVYATDLAGNVNSGTVVFIINNSVDLPFSVLSPTEGAVYGVSDVDLTLYTNSSDIVAWKYSLNGASNVTFTPNTTISVSLGSHYLIVYALDVLGNVNSSRINFSFNLFLSGNGTLANPYLIYNCSQLQNIQYGLTANYTLANNIDCSDTINWNSGAGFAPLGEYSVGNFEGNGKTISNLFINRSADDVGLFTSVSNVQIKNLKLDSPQISGLFSVGALVGKVLVSSNFSNIVITNGTVHGSSDVGGLIGRGDDFINLTSSNFSGSVYGFDGNYGVGGLVGGAVNGVYVYDCHVDATIYSNLGEVGGLIGYASASSDSNATILDSSAVGTIYAYGNSIWAFGGLLGDIYGYSSEVVATVESSYSKVNIYANGTPVESVGGFIGYTYYTAITNSYSQSTISLLNETCSAYNEYCGGSGFIGEADLRTTIENSYASGSITSNSSAAGFIAYPDDNYNVTNSFSAVVVNGGNVGAVGFAGILSPDQTTDGISLLSGNYWLNSSSGNASDCMIVNYGISNTSNVNCTARTSASSFYGSSNGPMDSWDTSIWDFYSDRYPTLKWESSSGDSGNEDSGSSGGGGGGGGGGGSSASNSLSSEGVVKSLSVGGRWTFVLLNQNHSIFVENLTNQTANIVIRSDPINLTLKIGEEKKLNLSSLLYYDLYLKLESISDGIARITLKQINEPIFKEVNADSQNNVTAQGNNTNPFTNLTSDKSGMFFKYGLVIVAIIFVILIVLFIFRKIRKNSLVPSTK